MAKVLVVYATDNGGTKQMADAVVEGAKSVSGTEVELKEAENTTLDDLIGCDGLVIGSPVHMGSMDWRIKKFIDTVCSGPWMKDQLIGRLGAVFACGSGYGNAGGGCELTMLAILNNLAELGFVLLPLPKNSKGYDKAGLQWGPYGRAHAPNLDRTGLDEEKLESSKSHGANVARAAAAIKGADIFQ
jgi:NAD(P)H dehydrogenase (quinone)